jgi:ketosteroid isomerase-like protein
MSQENVDVMREAFEAFGGEDPTALAGLLDPEVEWKALEDAASQHGLEGVLQSLGAWYEVWDEVHIELEELIDAGSDVVAVVRMRGRHAGSQTEIAERFFQIWSISDGKIVRFHEYRTKHEALEAAGLSERDAHADS